MEHVLVASRDSLSINKTFVSIKIQIASTIISNKLNACRALKDIDSTEKDDASMLTSIVGNSIHLEFA
jgi:hypothetical protein